MNTLSETGTEILPPNPIRVETALSRYPVHRLAKHGDIVIDIRLADKHGEASIKWEVTHNSKYGQPGPLAYKLDTLIINRRIEEAARPIPNIIRLGTLKEICRELDSAESGQNTNRIKNALYQNAFAAITAKIRYKTVSKTADVPDAERTIEFGDTRYGVVFTGETLPDGRTADAVYIVLHEFYREILDNAKIRPLDYDYLKGLNPASQRFYELLSYQMYAAIKNGRPRAKLVYSEFCTYAPQTRLFDWERVRSQMNKIYRPHKQSGYIAEADYEQMTDNDGRADWIMLYRPGPKARAEYRAFAKRGGPAMPMGSGLSDAGPPPRLAAPEPTPLETELIDRGITAAIAANLSREHAEEEIRFQIEILDWHLAKKPGKIDDPAAWLVSAIKNGHAAPKSFTSRADRRAREEAKQAKDRQAAEERRRKHEEEARERAERQAINAYWESLTPRERAELDAAANAGADPEQLAMEHGVLKRLGQQLRRQEHIGRLLKGRQPAAT